MGKRNRKPRRERITETVTEAHDSQVNDDTMALRDKDGVHRQADRLMYGYDESDDE